MWLVCGVVFDWIVVWLVWLFFVVFFVVGLVFVFVLWCVLVVVCCPIVF